MYVPQVEESAAGGTPEELVIANAQAKARAGLARAGEGDVILAVDTDVVIDGRIIGKPEDAVGARRHLAALSARAHEVLSGVVLLGPLLAAGAPPERTGLERTRVRFRALEGQTIDAYVESGEWRDRAGGYAVQGLGSMLVEGVEGDLSNVIGLPLPLLARIDPALFGPTR